MARSSIILPVVILALAGTFLTQVFVNPAKEATQESKTAMRGAKFGQPGFGGFGSVYGDTGGSSPVRSTGSPVAVSAPSSSGSGGSIVADPNKYVIGITLFFFASVYANDQGFFGPW
eukprot:TRINITY_DN7016_c3_g1_i1.p1 TRINITY_DN7016_c3_g1~~TRINITY_DN7016_c3_g1_i1.p1  ORF type:complete len:117 (+),score=23.75 TRINITY_DN7016_c3_g1_i1:92-442(+)